MLRHSLTNAVDLAVPDYKSPFHLDISERALFQKKWGEGKIQEQRFRLEITAITETRRGAIRRLMPLQTPHKGTEGSICSSETNRGRV